MSEGDSLAIILAVISVGAGTYMATFERDTLRKAGIGLIAIGVLGGVAWIGHYGMADAQSPPGIQQYNQSAPNVIAPGNGNQFNFAPSQPTEPHDNTFVGAVPPGLAQGSNNTVVMPTDGSTSVIMNRGGTAIGAGACADSTSIAIGSGANAGACARR